MHFCHQKAFEKENSLHIWLWVNKGYIPKKPYWLKEKEHQNLWSCLGVGIFLTPVAICWGISKEEQARRGGPMLCTKWQVGRGRGLLGLAEEFRCWSGGCGLKESSGSQGWKPKASYLITSWRFASLIIFDMLRVRVEGRWYEISRRQTIPTRRITLGTAKLRRSNQPLRIDLGVQILPLFFSTRVSMPWKSFISMTLRNPKTPKDFRTMSLAPCSQLPGAACLLRLLKTSQRSGSLHVPWAELMASVGVWCNKCYR